MTFFRGFLQAGVARDAARNDQTPRAELLGGPGGAAQKLVDHRALEGREQVERGARRHLEPVLHRGVMIRLQQRAPCVDFLGHVPRLHPAQHRGLQAAEAEVERVALHARRRERYRSGIALGRQLVDHRPARIAEAQEFSDLVERLAGGVVASFAEQPVHKTFPHFKKMGVAAAHYQRQRGKLDLVLAGHRMNVPFDVIHRDERKFPRKGERLGVSDAHQQRANQSRTLRHRDRRQVLQARGCFFEGQADRRHDGAQVLPRGEFGNHAAVARVCRHLPGDHRGEDARAVLHHCRGRFIARRFDAEDPHYLLSLAVRFHAVSL